MKKSSPGLKAGDSVIVKKGVVDSDSGMPMDGWQGRIEKIEEHEGNPILLIAWDSITLKNMSKSFLEECEEDGMNWRTYYLEPDDVEPAKSRDAQRDVAKAVKEIENKLGWAHLGEEGKRINKVLAGIALDDEWGALEAWEDYFRENLSFPFEAEISEYQERGRLQAGDKLTVTGISDIDDKYGVIVKVRQGSERFEFPLCDLEVIGKKASKSNKQIVQDYAVWFANR